MNTLLILLAPSANRVYAGAADGLVAAELQILLGDDQLVIEPITVAGIGDSTSTPTTGCGRPSAGCPHSSPRTSATMIIYGRSRCRDLICSMTIW